MNSLYDPPLPIPTHPHTIQQQKWFLMAPINDLSNLIFTISAKKRKAIIREY